jgi:hypothetical protein
MKFTSFASQKVEFLEEHLIFFTGLLAFVGAAFFFFRHGNFTF